MMKLTFLFCSVFLFIRVNGQDQKVVDSLEIVSETADVCTKFLALYELTFQYTRTNNHMALRVIQQAEAAALETRDSLYIVKSKRVKGQLAYFLENMIEAERSLLEAWSIAVRNQYATEIPYIEHTLSNVNLFNGDYDKALKWEFNAFERAGQLSDTVQIYYSLNGMAMAYYKLKDYNKALHYYEQALAYTTGLSDASFLTANIALCYAHLGKFDIARQFASNALRECGAHCSNRYRMNIEYTFGVIALGEEDYTSAERHFYTSYVVAKQVADTRFQLDNIYLLSDMKIRSRSFKDAELFLLEAENLIDHGTPFKLETIKILSSFSRLYLEMRNFEKAAHYQSRYISLKDSIYNEELTTSLMETEAEYLERENKLKISAQDEIIELKEKIIDKQEMLNQVILLMSVSAMICVLSLLRNYRQKKNLSRLLEKKVQERTRALQVKQDQLVRVCEEHDLLIKRTSYNVSQTVKTIQGLCINGMKEISDPVALSYIKRIDCTSKHLNGVIACRD